METDLRRPIPVFGLDAETRGAFITRTYMHLFGAIIAFTLLPLPTCWCCSIQPTLINSKGHQGKMACPFDGHRELALMGSTISRYAPRQNLAALSDEIA